MKSSKVSREFLCLACLREGNEVRCADRRQHLDTAHARDDSSAGPGDLIPIYGKIDRRTSEKLREVQRDAIDEMLHRLPQNDARRLRSIMDAADRFLPEEFGGSPRRQP